MRVYGRDRYDQLRPEPEPAGRHYEDLRRTQQRVDDQQRTSERQSRQAEPRFDNAQETHEARYAALSEIVKERLESGKINSSEATRTMFSFEYDGSMKYRNEVIARMWQHRDLSEMRDIAAEARGYEVERERDRGMER